MRCFDENQLSFSNNNCEAIYGAIFMANMKSLFCFGFQQNCAVFVV